MKNNHLKYILMFCMEIQTMCIAETLSEILYLNEGDVCGDGFGVFEDSICTKPENCAPFKKDIEIGNRPDICSFIGELPIICCAGNLKARSNPVPESTTDKMCSQYYSEPADMRSVLLVVGGEKSSVGEFPHMAIIGYGMSAEEGKWGCGGSLISDRWILTAAHCLLNSWGKAKWVRLGDLDIASAFDDVRPLDYQISKHILHPNYKAPSNYNDIALFRLSENVVFSKHILPICLNVDQSLNPPDLIATGWGRTSIVENTSDFLLKVDLDVIPADQCNASYFTENNVQLQFGITPDSMICAGSAEGDRDTCLGDSGGPLQAKYISKHGGIYLQVGIVSFGKYCGDKYFPGVYTRVSNYIPWIERIVWPENQYN